jgi:hypothetical protein
VNEISAQYSILTGQSGINWNWQRIRLFILELSSGANAMKRSSSWSKTMAAVVFSLTAFFNLYALAARKQTFTGEVGDAMCGRQHMEGTPAECTHTCVARGSKYALAVGDKLYILDTTDKAVLATLDKQAGKNVTVTGTLDKDTITVSSVAAK